MRLARTSGDAENVPPTRDCPHHRAGLRLDTARDAVVGDHEEQPVPPGQRRLVGDAASEPPRDVRRGDVAGARRADGDQARPFGMPVGRRPCRGRSPAACSPCAAALLQAPALLAGHRIVAVGRLADPRLMSSGWPLDLDDVRRRERLAEVSLGLWLPSGPRSLKSIERGVATPSCRSSCRARRRTDVDAVEVHDQQIAEDDRRRAGAAEVIALEVAARPEHLAGLRVERRGARRAERDVDAAASATGVGDA